MKNCSKSEYQKFNNCYKLSALSLTVLDAKKKLVKLWKKMFAVFFPHVYLPVMSWSGELTQD